MTTIKGDILNCLKDLKGNGKFASKGTAEFRFPGLHVEGLGELSYPVNKAQAQGLIQVAHMAPFGKGSTTIFDKEVRNVWEIDAKQLIFTGPTWDAFLKKTLSRVKCDLGLEDNTISAHLYKLLIYEEGSFFLPHKDTEKEKGMFGTLVIGLPSIYSGGELVVSFRKEREVIDFAAAPGDYKLNYAAFYADCDHEVKPLTSGYRICLVYHLVQVASGDRIKISTIASHAAKLAEVFAKHRALGNLNPYFILLGHQYTPENFSANSLKLHDRTKAETILRAAQIAGHYAKLCLVTSYLTGVPDNDGYYGYGACEGPDENGEIVEVIDEALSIEYWADNEIPALSRVHFQEEDLIAAFDLKDGVPIIKESTGYMGNYGPDLMHWYHYGAVVVWSPEVNAQLLLRQDTESKLIWLDYFNKNQSISDGERDAINTILIKGFEEPGCGNAADFNAIADWIINRNDQTFFLKLTPSLCQFYFTKIDVDHWILLIDFWGPEITETTFSLIMQDAKLSAIEQLITVAQALSAASKYKVLMMTQIKKLPYYFSAVTNQSERRSPSCNGILYNLFLIERKIPQDEVWTKQMDEVLMHKPTRAYVREVIAPQLLALRKEKTALALKLLLHCQQYLQQRVGNKPQPPTDWAKQVPDHAGNNNHWKLLRAFLESPFEKVFDYQRNLQERNELEYTIRHTEIDLKMETIKKGSPHTLRLTKTHATYHKALKDWEEDCDLLSDINRSLGR